MLEEKRAPIENTRGSGSPQNRQRSSDRNRGPRKGNKGNYQKGGARLNPDRAVKRTRPKKKPLTFWQKILSLFGLYKPKQDQRHKGGGNHNAKSRKQGRQGAARKKTNRRIAPSDPAKVNDTRLYVGNLSYETTEYELEELFKGIGKVKSIEVVYNRRTHKSKGFAFVQMQSVEEAKRAVEVLHDQPFMGRQMIVNGAKSKGAYEERDPIANQEIKETSEPLIPKREQEEVA